jgi:carboxylesterase
VTSALARLLRRGGAATKDGPTTAPVVPGAEPYYAGSGPLGVLLCHGFTGSPVAMRPWADHLVGDGFRVAVPRLPGHGTSWQEMNRTRWEDWYACVDRAFIDLRAECEQVFVGGLSMGGGLAIRVAEQHGDAVAGLAVVNPSINSADPRMRALPVLRHFVPSLGAISGDIALPDAVEGAYDRTPLHAAWSIRLLWRDIQAHLDRVDQPLLIFKSVKDTVVDPSSLALIKNGVRSTDLTVVRLERSYHVATLDYDAELIFTTSSAFFHRLANKERGRVTSQ